jgi:hypothetical protein
MCVPCESTVMMGEGLLLLVTDNGSKPPPSIRRGRLWCWPGNELVLSNRVKLCEHDSRLVSVAKRNTDEPLVEASLVGNALSKGTSYPSFVRAGMGVPISVAVVSRCWLHGNPSKGGRSATQALPCNRGEPDISAYSTSLLCWF